MMDDEEAPAPESLMEDSGAGPETFIERADMMTRLRRIIAEELTDRQRQALLLLSVQDVPMDEAARKLKTNRNALYKLLHDARLRLKRRLSLEGLSAQEVLAAFETG
jgi:RNA polymerase sigma-70 factor (ECF subfamily)